MGSIADSASPGPPSLDDASTRPNFSVFVSAEDGSRDRRLADAAALVGALVLLAISVADHHAPSEVSKRLTSTLVGVPVIIAELSRAVVILSTGFALAQAGGALGTAWPP